MYGNKIFDRQTDNYNYSVAFMKAFLSFCVVCCHYWHSEHLDFYPVAMLYRMRGVAVPIFVLISFFLTEKMYSEKKVDKFKKRLWRLLFPFFVWGILYFVGYRIIDIILKSIGFEQGLSIAFNYKDLIWQLIFGSDRYLCPQLWYQFALIVITIVMWIVYRCFCKYSWHIILSLSMIALWLQYSGLNYRLFGEYEYEVRYSTGRVMEVIPLACIGLALVHYGIADKLKQFRYYTLLMCIFGMLITAYGSLFTIPSEGFGYGGTYIIAYAVLAFTAFYMFPFEKLPDMLKAVLKFLSRYSFGVFCIHFGVGYCWNTVLCPVFGWRANTYTECIWIYIICICVSWLMSLIPIKYARQLVE